MNPNELYDLQIQLIGIINDLWELWLGGTFAFVVAFHAGRGSINGKVVVLGCAIYISASALILARYIDYGGAIGRIVSRLNEAGFENLQPAPWAGSGIYTIVTVLIIVIGTAAATSFAISQYRSKGDA